MGVVWHAVSRERVRGVLLPPCEGGVLLPCEGGAAKWPEITRRCRGVQPVVLVADVMIPLFMPVPVPMVVDVELVALNGLDWLSEPEAGSTCVSLSLSAASSSPRLVPRALVRGAAPLRTTP